MVLRDIASTLPTGFRFCPSDEELVFHYLYRKRINSDRHGEEETLMVVNLHTCEPSELPDAAKLNDNEWYFFSFRDRRYSTGSRSNRASGRGYWKATGKDRVVQEPSRWPFVGMRKTLVFYAGRAPAGVKSDWVMHEFRLENTRESRRPEDWVLCRVFYKPNKKGGSMARYGVENEQSNDSSSSFPLWRVDNPGADYNTAADGSYWAQPADNYPHAAALHFYQGDRGLADEGCSTSHNPNGFQTSAWQYALPCPADTEADNPAVDGAEEYWPMGDTEQDHDHYHGPELLVSPVTGDAGRFG